MENPQDFALQILITIVVLFLMWPLTRWWHGIGKREKLMQENNALLKSIFEELQKK